MAGDKDPSKALEPSLPLLDYGCKPWRLSSQRVADMYDAGTKLWTKSDLVDIERQLENSATLDSFTIQSIDGKQLHVKNPLFGIQRPIWKPFVKYQDYWKLVLGDFNGPPELFYSTYHIDWKNQVDRDFRGNIEDWTRLFETKSHLWAESITCESFRGCLKEFLAAHPKVNKVICFGLGDMARREPEVTVRGPWLSNQASLEPTKSNGAEVHKQMIQHAAALTIAEEIRLHRGGEMVRLLTQDPQYTDDTKDHLRGKGFEIVGNFGAGGFDEVDDESLVFSTWPSAPVKQMVADLARPAGFITLGRKTPFNTINVTFTDAESPRTEEMWRGYECWDFPTSPVEVEMMEGLHGLKVFARI